MDAVCGRRDPDKPKKVKKRASRKIRRKVGM